jgi:hypothetical protein
MNENSAEKLLQFNTKKCKFLRLGKNKENQLPHDLEVDSWNIHYDEDDNLIETEGRKVKLKEVTETKYLGFVISENASNVPNIADKQKKSIGTIKTIINIIKGLETYTVRNGLIYLNSLLRSSILYGAETYYNLTENNIRMIERIEEECLSKILDTGKNCPVTLLYLETGQLPAKFQIQIMVLNFLKYILDQDKNTLIHKFFTAQCQNPTKGDWVSNTRKIMKETEITETFEDISFMKKQTFKKYVMKKVNIIAFQYLLSRIKSKGQEIKYGQKLECQGYLLPNNILTLQDQRDIFSYRSRMNKLEYNYKGNNIEEKCYCGKDMTNIHLYECQVLNNSERKVQYSKIFDGRLCELKYD